MMMAPQDATSTHTYRIHVIDLDDASTQVITWDPHISECDFESRIETQLRHVFGISDDAWVDLFDPVNACLIPMNKEILSKIEYSLCLCLSPKTPEILAPMKQKEVFEVIFEDMNLGMSVSESNGNVIVHDFKASIDGTKGKAETCGQIQLSDIIYKVQGARTVGRRFDVVMQMLQTSIRPLSIQFFRPFSRDGLHAVEFHASALNMTITRRGQYVIVKALPCSHPGMCGYAEARGVRIGDVIHAVDGEVVQGVEYSHVVNLLSRSTRPLVVVFARKAYPIESPGNMTDRYSFASSTMTSPLRHSMIDRHHLSLCSTISSGIEQGRMHIQDMIEYCQGLVREQVISMEELEIVHKMILSVRPDICCAIKHGNQNAVVAIVRSPKMHIWDHLLKLEERIILAGPISIKRKKRFHLILTNHKRLLFVNKETNGLEEEIMCCQIVTISSRSKYGEIHISTSRMNMILLDTFIGPIIWVRAILPFTCTQGYLKVDTSRRFLRSKKRYFVLQGNKLMGYKKEQMVHQIGASYSSVILLDATVEITDPHAFTFIITTPQSGKKLILTAPSAREFNKWISAFTALNTSTDP